MSIEVKVGQVWRDKDKRRNTVIEIIEIIEETDELAHQVIGLVVGTEEERAYLPERLVKRWELIDEKGDPNEVEEALKPAPEITLNAIVDAGAINDGVVEPEIDTELEAVLTRKKKRVEKASKPVRVVGGKNYHLLVECPVNGPEGQRFRTTMKQFEAFGAPLCGCHHKPMNLIEKH